VVTLQEDYSCFKYQQVVITVLHSNCNNASMHLVPKKTLQGGSDSHHYFILPVSQ